MKQMKAIEGYDKLRGGYYTPSDIADFIVNWTIQKGTHSVLEPSCGDGSFLSSLNHLFRPGTAEITGVELDVLIFEPGEMRQMRIPMNGAENIDLQKIDTLQRAGHYEDILDYTDKILLLDGLGLSQHDVTLLHSIWDKMRNRHLARKKR